MLQIVWGHNGSGAFGTSQHPRGVRVQLVPAIHTCYFQKIGFPRFVRSLLLCVSFHC